MKIWLVTIGEPIFHPENKLRLHRTGILSKHLSENTSHEVVWWTSTFCHFTKKHLYNEDSSVDVMPRLKMIAIKGKGYKKNISIDRIIDHLQIAKKFSVLINKKERPDIIVVAFPTLGLCKAALDYGKRNRIPVLVDYRDMWPEVYIDVIPKKIQLLGQLFLRPLFKKVENIFNHATGVLGITQDFLNLALKKINRPQKNADGVFTLGYLKNQFEIKDLEEANDFWEEKLNINGDPLRICFFGAIGYQSNWETICKAAIQIQKEKLNIEIIVCGSGDKLQYMKDATKGIDNIVYPGFVSASQISALMNISQIGLCAYFPKESYMNSIPGKAIEYMSAGLSILSTLKDGTLGKFIDKHEVGFHYNHDSAESFIDALKEIIQIKSDLIEKRNSIKKIYLERFDAFEVYKNYTKHLENIVLQKLY